MTVPGRRPPTARGTAIAALVAAEQGERANVVLPRLLGASSLSERDRHFATELTYGALRMARACDWLAAPFIRDELEPEVRAAIRAGTYQLAFMRVPPYAAVAATVPEVAERARGLVNAVLRRVSGVLEAGPVRWPDIGTRLSYPDWVVQRLGEDLGPERALAALETMNKAATVSVRPDGYTQDPASQAVAERLCQLVDRAEIPGPVLDLCAAPGGKATYIAGHYASGTARTVAAADIDARRAEQVTANASRLGLTNLVTVTAAGQAPPFRPATFAAALVDAPCSGLGVLRRRPDARWRVRPGDVHRLAALQKDLLLRAAGLVRPGGVLVYSVCTLSRAETEGVGEWAGQHLAGEGPQWRWLPLPDGPWEPWGHGALLLPQAAGTDGMYLAAWQRAG